MAGYAGGLAFDPVLDITSVRYDPTGDFAACGQGLRTTDLSAPFPSKMLEMPRGQANYLFCGNIKHVALAILWFRGLLAQNDFWKPLNGTEEALASGGLDGSRWIFEFQDKNGYRMLDIWTPDALAMPEKELKEAGLDPDKIRDFLIYKKTGNRILEIGKILPNPEDRY